MKKSLLAFFLSSCLLSAFGQLTNWRGEFHLQNAGNYDYDLQNWAGTPIPVYITVVIDIGADGTGRLVVFFGSDKNTWTIEKATYDESLEQITMNIMNPNGYRTHAYGVCHYKTCIQALVVDNTLKNQALVYYYDNANVNWHPVH